MRDESNLNEIQSALNNKMLTNPKISGNPFFMYSKQVKSNEILPEEINSPNKKKQLSEVLDSLYSLEEFKSLDEMNIKFNCVKWVKSLFSDYPYINAEHIENLMHDFTDSMNTNMKERKMYVVSILTENNLILCHSKMGEKSINPDWKVFVRMLDKDNIKRYVSFELDKEIKVRFYEKERSKFFINWLGISHNESIYYYGGKNKFYTEIDSLPFSLEIEDDDFENILDKNKIRNKSIILDSKIRELRITHIIRGNKRYKNVQDFIKDYTARKFDLAYYKEKYKELNKSLNLIFQKIFDEEDAVMGYSKDNKDIENYYLKKENSKVDIIFCNKDIEIRDNYLEKFKIALINKEKIRIFHAGMAFNENPLIIKNFEIYNVMNSTLAKPLIDYFNNKDLSESLGNDLRYAIFNLLTEDNKNKPIYTFLRELTHKLIGNLEFSSDINEDSVIELKSILSLSIDDDNDFVDKMAKDVAKKTSTSEYKLYIIGYSEKFKKYEPFPDNYDDSRIAYLNKSLKESTGYDNLELFKINIEEHSCIFMLAVKRKPIQFFIP